MVKVSPVEEVRLYSSPRRAALTGLLAGVATLLLLASIYQVHPEMLGNLLWMLPVFGAVSNTAPAAIAGGLKIRTFTVTATLDADTTTGAIAHGFLDGAGVAAAPDIAIITPILAAARISLWVQSLLDATNITLLKATTAGSGDAAAQIRVTMIAFHSLIR